MEVYTIIGAVIWSLVLSILFYWYFTRNHGYFKERGIPFVPPVPILGSVGAMFLKHLHEVELDRYKKYGKIYGYFEGNSPTITVAEPDLIRSILVKDFHAFTARRNMLTGDPLMDKMAFSVQGKDWKRIRSIMTPAFTTGKIKRMVSIFKECAETLSQNFEKASKDGKSVDLKPLFGAFTMDVIASSVFSTKIDSHNDPNNKFVQQAKTATNPSFPWRMLMFLIAPKLSKLLKIKVIDPGTSKFFKTIILQIIEERKKTQQKRNDFLQLLLDTVDELAQELNSDERAQCAKFEETNYENSDLDDESNELIYKYIYKKRPLTMNELIAQCLLFFLVGYDTTASTLSFISHALAIHPDVQEKLIAQIDDALTKNKGELPYEAIHEMKYLDNIMSEALRLFPPAVRLERAANEDYKLGNTGITVPKGMVVGVPIYAMHLDPEYFPDPEKFDPDRFNEVGQPYTYLPFGSGPRNCIGMRFVITEVKVCLTHILSKFRFKKAPETKVPVECKRSYGLLSPKDVTVKLEIRKDTYQNEH